MKFAISLIVVLGMLLAIPIFLFGDLEMLKNFGFSSESSFWDRARAPKGVTSVTTDQKVKVYKWRDETGVMQFTSHPPPEQQAEEVMLEPNTNIVQAVEVPEEKPEDKPSGPSVMSISSGQSDAMKDILGSTAASREDMNKQQQEQQKILDQIMGKSR